MMLSLDAQKAFNQIKWNFLYHTLMAFGFHSTFTEWVKTKHKKSKITDSNQ